MKSVELRNVSVVKDGNRILDSIDLDIGQSENVALIGGNGSGKTTLIKVIGGSLNPYYDEVNPPTVRIFGESNWNVFDLRKMIGVVSMDIQSGFCKDTTVFEAIASGYFGSMDIFRNMVLTEDMREQVWRTAMTMGVEDLLGRQVENLSLGEMRRTLISRALIMRPKALLLDEPMTGLDIVMKSKFRGMFDILMENLVSMIMVTHELEDIPQRIDRIVMVKDGRIFRDGCKKDLLTSDVVSDLYGKDIDVSLHNGVYSMKLI